MCNSTSHKPGWIFLQWQWLPIRLPWPCLWLVVLEQAFTKLLCDEPNEHRAESRAASDSNLAAPWNAM